jgi:hypothetical protein
MADAVRKVEYFSITVPNTPAKAFGVLSTLVSSGVDLLACIGVPRGRRARIDVVPADTRRFKIAVNKAGLAFTPEKSGFLIQGKDRPGALTDHLEKLGDHDVNVTGIDALSAGEGRWGAIIWVEDEAVRKAARVLGAKAAVASSKTPQRAASTARAVKKTKAPERKTRKKK